MTFVRLIEVGPRDGLQNEPCQISLEDKVALVDILSKSGLRHIECASFVSPKWVPQMAGSDAVLRDIKRNPLVQYAALTPNSKGLEAAIGAGADEIAVFASASEGFSRANINVSVSESLDRYRQLVQRAKDAGLPVRGYVSCVISCPYDGPTKPDQVTRVARELLEMGCYEISLGDTLGSGTPETINKMIAAVLDIGEQSDFAGHFHNTNGRALDNIAAAIDLGLAAFDTSIGGLGGCPFAPGASGNVATEDVMAFLNLKNIQHGLDEQIIKQAAAMAQKLSGGTDV